MTILIEPRCHSFTVILQYYKESKPQLIAIKFG